MLQVVSSMGTDPQEYVICAHPTLLAAVRLKRPKERVDDDKVTNCGRVIAARAFINCSPKMLPPLCRTMSASASVLCATGK